MLVIVGVWYWRHSRRLAAMLAGQVSAAPAWRRLWLPRPWWSERQFLFQLRVSAAGTVAIGLLLLFLQFAQLRSQG